MRMRSMKLSRDHLYLCTFISTCNFNFFNLDAWSIISLFEIETVDSKERFEFFF